jgi:hypothetical protein
LRDFVHISGALRAQALIPMGSGPPAVVSCVRMGPLEIVIGEKSVELPHDTEIEAPSPDLSDMRLLPPFEVDADRGEVAGMIGGLELLRDVVVRIAEAIGGGAVVVAEMESTTPDVPLAVSARAGEPALVAIGEETFDLP